MNRLIRSGLFKALFGLFGVSTALYIMYWPADATAWLTDWLYRLQDPIDGSPATTVGHDWHNVTIGLLVTIGGWTLFSGLADAAAGRRIAEAEASGDQNIFSVH